MSQTYTSVQDGFSFGVFERELLTELGVTVIDDGCGYTVPIGESAKAIIGLTKWTEDKSRWLQVHQHADNWQAEYHKYKDACALLGGFNYAGMQRQAFMAW